MVRHRLAKPWSGSPRARSIRASSAYVPLSASDSAYVLLSAAGFAYVPLNAADSAYLPLGGTDAAKSCSAAGFA